MKNVRKRAEFPAALVGVASARPFVRIVWAKVRIKKPCASVATVQAGLLLKAAHFAATAFHARSVAMPDEGIKFFACNKVIDK